MEIKDLLAHSIEEISAEELSDLQLVIADELEHRRFRAKEAAWNKLVDAIKDYSTTFGNIEVITDDDTFYMTSLDDFSSIGQIEIKFD
jgi:hypothetical protein